MLAKVQMPEPKFQISTLEIEDEHVFLTTMDGGEHVGRMFLTNTGKQRFERWEGGKRYSKLPYQFVSLWRPIDLRKWPFVLPSVTATLSKDFTKPIAARNSRADGDLEEVSYLYSASRLGRVGEAPTSIGEVEERIIRALRTAYVLERETVRSETLWPRPWLDEQVVIRKMLERMEGKVPEYWRDGDALDYHVDRSNLDARPARFTPTPRDVSDYEAKTHLEWLSLMWQRDRSLFHLRAYLPPFPWWAIADEQRVDEGKIRDRYKGALVRVFEEVRAR